MNRNRFDRSRLSGKHKAAGVFCVPGQISYQQPASVRDRDLCNDRIKKFEGVGQSPASGMRDCDVFCSGGNAAVVVDGSGLSAKKAWKWLAAAHEIGMTFDRSGRGETFQTTPYVSELEPDVTAVMGSHRFSVDAGSGRPEVKRPAISGKSFAENLENVTFNTGQDAIYPVSNLIRSTCRVERTNQDFVVEDVFAAVEICGCRSDEDIVIRKEEVHNASDMRDVLSATAALYGQGDGEKVVLITNNCFSGEDRGGCIEGIETGKAIDGPKVSKPERDTVSIIAMKNMQGLKFRAEERSRKTADWLAPASDDPSGTLRKYAKQVETARTGAVTHPGGREEIVCYADI